jgi:type I restriction enzyme S subunit
MTSNWKTCQLGELVTFTSGGTPSKKKAEYWNGSIPWISAKTMKDEHISTSDLMISEEGLKNGSRLAPQGSILFLIRGSGLFNGIPICLVDKPVAFNQDVKCINSISEIENKYVFYWLLSQASTLSAIVGVTTIGAGKFDMDVIKRLEISYPEKEVRNEIIRIADAISDKIRLNTAINENLELQAQAIFKSWFVDFEPFGGVMPVDWNVGAVADVLSGKRPPMKQNDKTEDASIPLIGAAAIMGYTNKFNHDDKILVIGRVGTHGIVQRFDYPCWTSDNTLVIKSNYYEYTYQILKLIDYKAMNRGSTQPLITQGDLKKTEIIIPSKECLQKYENIVGSLMYQYSQNRTENEKLALLRDTLLPKLMNGEIDVSKVRI